MPSPMRSRPEGRSPSTCRRRRRRFGARCGRRSDPPRSSCNEPPRGLSPNLWYCPQPHTRTPPVMARVKDNYRTISGTEKAAIFLLSLPQAYSKILFERMDEDEIKELSMTMATLGKIDSSIVERLFIEFADHLSSTGSLVGS